jgi:CheY-like chemotaxis protein
VKTDAKRPNALIVDDNDIVRTVVQRVLERCGALVTACGDGREARKLAKKREYDLVFLDLFLPYVDGWELLELFRSRSPKTKVAIISGAPISQEEKDELTKRVDAFIDKDTFELPGFEALARKLLGTD